MALNVVGLMNVQYAVKGDDIYILEVNPRASRTVPFVAKVIGRPIAGIAARVMSGEPLGTFDLKPQKLDHVAVKEAVFPFARFPGVDTILGPEMRSTGEVMGIDRDYAMAFAKSQLGGGQQAAAQGRRVRFGARCRQGEHARTPCASCRTLGFRILATRGTKRALDAHGIRCENGQQGAGGPAAHRRSDEERRGAAGFQHHRGRQGARPIPRISGALPCCTISPTIQLWPARWRRLRPSKHSQPGLLTWPRCNPM